MRILLLNQFFPPDTAATGQLLADLARGLADAGHDVHVLASRRPYGGGPARYPKCEQVGGATVHRVRATGFGRSGTLGRLVDYASFYTLAWLKALTIPRPDICVCLTTPPTIGTIGRRLGQFKKTKLILWVMDLYPQIAAAYGYMDAGGFMYRRVARKNRRLYGNAQAIVALGDDMKDQLVAAGADSGKVHVVRNWVPGESVAAMSPDASALRAAYSPDGACVLMYSGNLGLGHELETAVKATAQLPAAATVRLALVGQGKAQPSLEALITSLGLTNVEFFPSQPLERLVESLAAGDVHLISQRDGTQGLIVPSKLYGVLAAARPVVFIGPEDCEVARTIAEARCGLIVPNADVDATAAAIATLARDPDLRHEMGQRGLGHYQNRFGRARSVAALRALIESIA